MRSRLAIAVALILVAVSVPEARANGYGDAKLLIQKAEKAFGAGDDEGALELLDEALYLQTTADKKKEPYGYARYIFYRLSRYYHEQGKAKKADKYAKKCVKAPEDHDWVDPEYWVPPYDPFLVENFPELTGKKVEKHPPHKIIPDGIGLWPGPGDFLYVLGNKTFYRLDRTTGELETLYERSVDYLYRIAVHDDDNRMLVYYEGDKFLYFITLSPFGVEQIPKGAGVDSLYIDEQGAHAVVYQRGGYAFKAVRTSLAEPHAHETLIEQEGRVLISSAENVLYATWSTVHGKSFHPYYSPMYEHVMARSFSSDSAARLFTFPVIDHRNDIHRIESRSGDVEGLYVTDFSRDTHFIIVQDWRDGSSVVHELPYKLDVDPCGSYCPLAAAFSHKEDYIVLLDIQEKQVRVMRYEWENTTLSEIGTIALPGQSKLEGKAERSEIHAVGCLDDNSTVWIHWGDYIVFMDPAGKSTIVDLRPFSKVKKPEWAGPGYYTSDPDQFYFGIEKGKGRYFMMVELEKLLEP